MSVSAHAAFIAGLEASRPEDGNEGASIIRLITHEVVHFVTSRIQIGAHSTSNALTMTQRPLRPNPDTGVVVLVGLDISDGPIETLDVLVAAGMPPGSASDLVTGQPARVVRPTNFPMYPWEFAPTMDRWIERRIPAILILVRTDEGSFGATTKLAEQAVPLPMRSAVSLVGVGEVIADKCDEFLAQYNLAPLGPESICVLQRSPSDLVELTRVRSPAGLAVARQLTQVVESGLEAVAQDMQEYLSTATSGVLDDTDFHEADPTVRLQSQLEKVQADADRALAEAEVARAELAKVRRQVAALEHTIDVLERESTPDVAAPTETAPVVEPTPTARVHPVRVIDPDRVFESFPELIEAARSSFDRLVLDADLSTPAAELDRHAKGPVWRARTWAALIMMQEYAEHRATSDEDIGSLRTWLTRHPDTLISPDNVATGETAVTAADAEFRQARMFAVPESVSPDGFGYFGAHIRIEPRRTSPAPRLHYLDDSARSGLIYVGYVGRHLPSRRGE